MPEKVSGGARTMPKVVPEYKTQARQRIVEAAQRVFSHRGFSGWTMDDIAAEVGVSKGALYLYFENKTELLRAIQEAGRETIAAQLEQLANAADIPEGLAAVVDQAFGGRPQSGVWYDLLVEAQSDSGLREALREDQVEDENAVRSFLSQLKSKGRLPGTLDNETRTVLLISVLEHAAMAYLLGFDRRAVRRSLLKSLRTVLAL